VATAIYFLLRKPKPVEWTPLNALEPSSVPALSDPRNPESLIRAIDQSLRYFEKADLDAQVCFGGLWFTAGQVRESLLDFKAALERYGLSEAFFSYVKENFLFFRTGAGEALFTGYYEADLNGSLTPSDSYRCPLYRKPEDLYHIDLSQFYFYKNIKGLPSILRGRVSPKDNKTIIPYYDRSEIDDLGRLTGKKLEIVWIDDPVDVFFLQIQGSGIVRLDSGETLRVNYAGTNGHPYRAIGRLMIERGMITREDMSMSAIRGYLTSHPEEMKEIFNYNPSYVFFRVVEEGPIGYIGVPLTPYRSIATDRRLFPKGALCYVETKIPVLDEQKKLKEWKPFRGFVLNQDTGGAIRTPGRVDLFTGYGETNRLTAGYMKQEGTFFFLVKKQR
jgi:membrane-bound lytic murein transglycosylase A